MTSNHKGRRAETVRLQNVSTTNPAQLWLAGLAPAGRKGMQSQLRRCAGILLPGSDIDSYPWQMLNYTGVMLVRSALLNEGYAVATVNMALSALKSVAGVAFSMGILDADPVNADGGSDVFLRALSARAGHFIASVWCRAACG